MGEKYASNVIKTQLVDELGLNKGLRQIIKNVFLERFPKLFSQKFEKQFHFHNRFPFSICSWGFPVFTQNTSYDTEQFLWCVNIYQEGGGAAKNLKAAQVHPLTENQVYVWISKRCEIFCYLYFMGS